MKSEDELARLLERMAAEEQSILEEALALDEAPGLEKVEQALQAEWQPENARKPGRMLAWTSGILGLAAVCLVVFAIGDWGTSNADSPPSRPAGQSLSVGDFGKLFPMGDEAQLGSYIEWSGPEAATYKVTVMDAGTGKALWSDSLRQSVLQLTDLETAAWGSEVLINVKMKVDDPGASASASLLWALRIPGNM